MVWLADTVVGRGESEHGELVSWYGRHLSLRGTAKSSELGQRIQRASLIFCHAHPGGKKNIYISW